MNITEFLETRIAEDEKLARAFVNELGEAKRWRAAEIGGELHQVGPRALGLSSLLATFDIHTEAEFVANWDPARVLAECAAKRVIIDQADEATGLDMSVDNDRRIGPRDESKEPYCGDVILKSLAAVYEDHPDYQQEWLSK